MKRVVSTGLSIAPALLVAGVHSTPIGLPKAAYLTDMPSFLAIRCISSSMEVA